ncbi:Glyoxylate reductase [Pyrolobus fumarii 1A]|uniref:Glyoxylate reductase n=1 Tax=Pyrolobus fumarii (strain DSM 11204 / 1A) TaxID=694429 RepID=G0ECG0_PYRF1|nr:NAD(P)-dependent oxidoreductase [Pyrolobus fumarii]AEM39530.1 Glyoxylate reductase [Pyrolobus fumarii 1A]
MYLVVAVEPLGLEESKVRKIFEETLGRYAKLVLYDAPPADQGELFKRIKDADIVVTVSYPISGEVIRKSEKLKMIAVSFTGYDHVDIEAAKERGIVVSNVPGYATDSVAELVFGLVIVAARRVIQADRVMRTGGWRTPELLGTELRGKTIGIVGFGAIGRRVAELAKAFGMDILVYDRSPWKEEKKKKAEEVGARFVSLDELMRKSDIVTVHVPLTSETRHMIRYEHLRLLKPGAILVNVARGAVIKEDDLVRFLKERKDVTACLDVYSVEPLPPDHELRKLENVILTPHIGFYTKEALERRTRVTFENIKAFIEGRPQNRVA